jgi:hypothetical protein
MRTVTFSNEKVYKALNESFVSTWINRNPKFHNCDLSTERRIVENSFECYPTKNFCTFFVTPDREVLHYFSGYYSPSFFLHEIEFVKALQKKACDDKGRLKKDAATTLRAMHAEHAAAHDEDAKRAQKVKPPSAGSEGWEEYKDQRATFGERKTNLVEGEKYLAQVHKALGKIDAKTGKPVLLEKVIRRYMGGNEFTEE